MSSSYSANQYESAFKSQKLLNWTVPKQFKERPAAALGHTTFIASDRGHLLPGVKAKCGSSWTSFQGTWDLPSRIPPVHINPTARSQEGQERLRIWGQSQHLVRSATGKPHKAQADSRVTSRAQYAEDTRADHKSEELQIHVSTPKLHEQEEPERPLSQQSQQSQAQSKQVSQMKQAESRPVSQQKQAGSRPASQQKQSGSRPVSQQKQAESRPASQLMQAESRPGSQQNHAESRPVSQQKQARSRPESQQKQIESRPASHQNQSRPPTQNQLHLTSYIMSKDISGNIEW
ncbi:protein Flattop [Brachyhypopomus gauderio]|uniref:protein Flattop n=1 Tax=Brachyhypopomus gauderio TaxID=698409 RepID=UPI0040428114